MGANVETLVKRAFARSILRKATEAVPAVSFQTMLNTLADSRIERTAGGKVLIKTEGNGHSTWFKIPNEFDTTDALALCEEIQNRFDEATSFLVTNGNATPTDSQKLTEILRNMERPDSTQKRYRDLRLNVEEDGSEDQE